MEAAALSTASIAETPALRALPAAASPRLSLATYDLLNALELERELGVSHPLAQVLVRRGLDSASAAREFLDAREEHPPTAFAGIERAVRLIERAIAGRRRITVHGDYDVDGVCATAILIRALRDLDADVNWYLPDRLSDGYGLSLTTVDRLAARGTELLITVDCGITAIDEVAAASEAGLVVIVTDHHAPRADGALPDCAIVHPKLCGYPAELCGSAVAHKLADALGAATVEDDLELVALATVADLMPLAGENRRIVRAGLHALANTAKPGLRALIAVAQADPSALDAGTLSFRLAPRINAAGRLRRADAALELLLCTDPARAEQIAAELDALNTERRAVEQRICWEAEAQVNVLGQRSAYVLYGEDWHPGVIGIVASRIVERYHRPTILIALDGELGTGSGRSIPGFDLLAGLDAAAGALERYGGHRAAAGLTIARERIEMFSDAFEQHARELLTPELLEPVERADAVVSGSDLGLALAEELELLEPCGIGNPRPRLLVPGARFADLRPMGDGRHLRFSVASGGSEARAVAFGCDGRLAAGVEHPADATFKLERNTFRGVVEPRLVLRHACCCEPGPITVVGEPEDYLAVALAELDAPLVPPIAAAATRQVLDRRGESPLAVIRDALAAGGGVLALCADVPRRRDGLAERTGDFTLASYRALAADPALAGGFAHLIALDPPSSAGGDAVLRSGQGFTQLAWGDAELRFAKQMHELEYALRASLVALYRSLRLQARVAGEELEHLLRGDGPHSRSAHLAGRLIRVLAELELVSLDRDLPALTLTGSEQTTLERSPAYRFYQQLYEDGQRFLSSANLLPSG